MIFAGLRRSDDPGLQARAPGFDAWLPPTSPVPCPGLLDIVWLWRCVWGAGMTALLVEASTYAY